MLHVNYRTPSLKCVIFVVSGHTQILALLIPTARGAKKSALAIRDRRGNTPLHLAALNNHRRAAVYLLELGADARITNDLGHTPSEVARLRAHTDMATLLETQMRGNYIAHFPLN